MVVSKGTKKVEKLVHMRDGMMAVVMAVVMAEMTAV